MKTIIFLTLFLGATALAKVETNQTLFPGKGQSETSVGVTSIFGDYQIDVVATGERLDKKFSSFMTNASFYYGFSEFGALGMELHYHQGRPRLYNLGEVLSSDVDGLGDIDLRYKGNFGNALATVYYSLGYSITPESATYDVVDNKSNAASGQNALLTSVAVVVPVSQWKWGASIDYIAKQEGQYSETSAFQTTDHISNGGSRLNSRAFVEFDNKFHPNIALANLRTYTTSLKTKTDETSIGGTEYYGVELSGRYALSPLLEIIPSIGAYNYQESLENIDINYNVYNVGVLGRLVF